MLKFITGDLDYTAYDDYYDHDYNSLPNDNDVTHSDEKNIIHFLFELDEDYDEDIYHTLHGKSCNVANNITKHILRVFPETEKF